MSKCIALISESVYPNEIGGMQKHTFEFAKELVRQNIKLILVYGISQGTNDQLKNDEELKKSDAIIIAIDFPKPGKIPGHYLRRSYQFSKKVYGSLSPYLDHIDYCYFQGFTAGYFLKKKNEIKAKIILNFHGLNMFQPTFGVRNKLQATMLGLRVKKQLRQADFIISLGGKLTQIIESLGINKNQIIVQPNAISESIITDKKSFLEQENLAFIFIGRDDRIKATDALIEAINRVKETKATFHFVGPFQQDKCVNPNIVFHGEIKDQKKLIQLIDACDVLISTSISEGLPTVILEAMARGLAIVSTKVGAIPEVLSEENGNWIENSNSDSIEKSIRQFISTDKEKIQSKKLRSIEISKNYTWKKSVESFLQRLYFH